jgi:hypothetical protein
MADITPPNRNNRGDETTPGPADEQAPRSPGGPADQPTRPASPGRRPLFRT